MKNEKLKPYIVMWNIGYGEDYDEVLAKDKKDASQQAYKLWRESAEENADYGVVGESTDDLRDEFL